MESQNDDAVDQRKNDNDDRGGDHRPHHAVETVIDALSEQLLPMPEKPLQPKIQRGRSHARQNGQEHGFWSHVGSSELGQKRACQDEEGYHRSHNGACMNRF